MYCFHLLGDSHIKCELVVLNKRTDTFLNLQKNKSFEVGECRNAEHSYEYRTSGVAIYFISQFTLEESAIFDLRCGLFHENLFRPFRLHIIFVASIFGISINMANPLFQPEPESGGPVTVTATVEG
jgi:hypothetical protein